MTESSDDDSNAVSVGEMGADQERDPIIVEMIEALDSVPDPCCVLSGKNLSILDLGLINRIDRHGDTIVVGVTLTDTMCEFSHKIFADIESLANVVPGVTKVTAVPEVLPIWSPDRLSNRAVGMIKGDAGRFFRHWDLEKATVDAED